MADGSGAALTLVSRVYGCALWITTRRMSEWTDERITLQRELALAGRAGLWILLQGGPRNDSRAFVPHLDWPLFVIVDAEGATWSFASPPAHLPLPAGARIAGSYEFDRQQEVMIWRTTDNALLDIPSIRWTQS